ncbi:hypothetical protein D8674_015606 [Pyrus ussuriensis x Pyrus communis]|uniref:Uncharacterized protein n=1 Tax=Pyrus ussuriensis x Pyrus communis TaxID=2448454 RepID=A0A5N5H7I6_9ROSA|nr:hypothetical protein D8674_015606 [Pyrus ussuriensis x Pyrus communis]
MKNQMNACERHRSIGGEILSARKILDAHLSSSANKYVWEKELVDDPVKHSEDRISENQVSTRSLMYIWNFWKDKIAYMIECLGCLDTQDFNESQKNEEFCFNYFGVWRLYWNFNPVYVLLISDADWARGLDKRHHWKLVSINARQLASAARNYWISELLSVGMKVLDKLEELYKFPMKNHDPSFSQSWYLLQSKYLKLRDQDTKMLRRFVTSLTESVVARIFPLDSRNSVTENMISFRRNDASKNVLKQVIVEYTSSKNTLSLGKIGRLVMVILGTDWRRVNDFISPGCFMYLVERLVTLATCFQGFVITTRSCFVEWLLYQDEDTNLSLMTADVRPSLDEIVGFVIEVVCGCVFNKEDMIEWIKKFSRNWKNDYSPLLLRLVVLLCMVCVNFGKGLNILDKLLGRSDITQLLPREFYDVLKSWGSRKSPSIKVNVLVAAALQKIGNTMVIASFRVNCSRFLCSDAIFVDMKASQSQSRDDIYRKLFPNIPVLQASHAKSVEARATRSSSRAISEEGMSCKILLSNSGVVEPLETSVEDSQNAGEEHSVSNESNPKSSPADAASGSRHGSGRETGNQGKNNGQNKEVGTASGSQRGSNETGNQGKKKSKNKKPKKKGGRK